MAACFKLPSLAKKSRPPPKFPEFSWREVRIEAELGCGSFGSVYLVRYEKEERNVIVKKMKGESAEAKRRFEKEAGILNTVKGHRNVAVFLRFCQDPYAIMMEYSCFDFSPFGVDKKVSWLEDFVTSPWFTSPWFTSPRFFEYQETKPSNKLAPAILPEFHIIALSIVYAFHPTFFFFFQTGVYSIMFTQSNRQHILRYNWLKCVLNGVF